LWKSVTSLADEIKTELLSGYMSGKTWGEISRDILKKFNSSIYNSRRLVRTEGSFVANAAELDAYREAGIEQFCPIASISASRQLCTSGNRALSVSVDS
jgi:hypothetical protein